MTRMLVYVSVDADDDYPAARSAFGAAWHRLLTAIHATCDPQQKFDRATEAEEQGTKIVSEASIPRADGAYGIREAEDLSLTELGNRISMTKQGAYRLTSKSQARQKEQR